MQHITRAYNDVSIDTFDGTINKTSSDEKLSDEINYYHDLGFKAPEISILFPRMLDSNGVDKPYFIELEYYGYENLAELLDPKSGYSFTEDRWKGIAATIHNAIRLLGSKWEAGGYTELAKKMYIDKTEYYFEEFAKNDQWVQLTTTSKIEVNGKEYHNFLSIWKDVKDLISDILLPMIGRNVIHGDLCFSNILYGRNSVTNTDIVRFVDPRGRFGELGIMGDPLYDYAKLRHSYEGRYDSIIRDNFHLSVDGSKFAVSYPTDDYTNSLTRIFDEEFDFTETTIKKTRLIEGLIFIGMCSRHYDSAARQLAMYITGVGLLNEVLDENMH